MELDRNAAVLQNLDNTTAPAVNKASAVSAKPNVSIFPMRVFVVLSIIAVCLTLISFVGVVAYRTQLDGDVYSGSTIVKLVKRFDVRGESNTPSWFSSGMLLVSAALLGLIAADKQTKRDQYRRHWLVLAVIFALLSMDEVASLHEHISVWLAGQLHPTGLFTTAWVIPGLIFVIVVGLWYTPFMLNLPAQIRRWVILAAILFVTGALLLEMIEGSLMGLYTQQSIFMITINHVEDFLEMIGGALFLYALLSYLQSYMNPTQLTIRDQ